MTDDPRPRHGPERPLWGPRHAPVPNDAKAPPSAAPPTPSVSVPAGPPPAPPPPALPAPLAPPRSRTPLVLGVAGLIAALVVVGVVIVHGLRPGTAATTGSGPAAGAAPDPTGGTEATGPAATPGPVATSDDEPARTLSASAACVSAPSQDAAGNAVTYDPDEALDGRPDTAWRCDGDGVGQQIRIDLGRRVTLTGISIIPGYAKTDPADGADRYAQNRRISQVRYAFDDGTSVEHQLNTDPTDRVAQTLTFDPITTTSVTVTVLASVPGQQVGPYPPTDKVAISEVQVQAA